MDQQKNRLRTAEKVLARLLSGLVLAALLLCTAGCGDADKIAEKAITVTGTAAVPYTGFTIIANGQVSEEETTEPEPEADENDWYSQFILYIDAAVYNKPDLDASLIGEIPAGSVVRSLGAAADGTWSRISYNGRVAYINVYAAGIPESQVYGGPVETETTQESGYTETAVQENNDNYQGQQQDYYYTDNENYGTEEWSATEKNEVPYQNETDADQYNEPDNSNEPGTDEQSQDDPYIPQETTPEDITEPADDPENTDTDPGEQAVDNEIQTF